ncbi:MAG: discoidin domain-containing protein [Planctomycetes bacterium]|nr:discoidin domain-containing protein [Planctomycetota bacterium]
MGRRDLFVFLVLGCCLGVARGDLTMVPLSSWSITGDFGDVLALNGYPVDRLIVGKSVFANPPGTSANEPAEAADDFTLKTAACADNEPWVKTVFTQPVRIIFLLEKNGNDSGTIQGLDAKGDPVGGSVKFTGGSVYWKSTGYLASELSTQQIAFGAVLTSDSPIYGILITAPGIDPVSIMAVGGEVRLSSGPQPAPGATDVLRDVAMSWTPGEKAQMHDVYLGTVLADVNHATRTLPLNVLVSQDQDANSYDPGLLEFGRTYYWRIDDVNAKEAKVYKGDVWSFTVEPFAYPIPGNKITATASSSQDGDTGPEKTIDGSGLVNGQHSSEMKTMWLSGPGDPGSAWIRYDFDRLYKLHQMLVWNYNGPSILTGYGLQKGTIEYSQDGTTWTVLPNAGEFAQAPGGDGYASDIALDCAGVVARSIRITADSNWGGSIFNQYGLSEVSFLYVPVAARAPHPADGAVGVDPQAVLSWRAGREAGIHQVYLGADIGSLAVAGTISEPRYEMSVELGRSYVWKVVEVNEARVPASWASDVWSFSTAEYLVVDDFESYNEAQGKGTRIYEAWMDGWTDPKKGGSQVGYQTAPFTERQTVHGDKQSMPLSYDNTGATTFSEAELSLASADWTRAGVKALVLYFHGAAGNTGQLYLKVNGTKVVYNGDAADIGKPQWTQWNIDLGSLGVNLQKVTALTIGIDGTGAKGTLFIDDIRLYRVAPALPQEQIWIEAEATTTMTPPLLVYTDKLDASGGKYLGSPDASLARTTAAGPGTDGTGLATYRFTVKGGTYTIRVREIVPSTSSDSWWVRIQGATLNTKIHVSGWIQWNNAPVSESWSWNFIYSSDDGGKTVLFTLPAGTYTLEMAYREDGCLLDALVITAQ